MSSMDKGMPWGFFNGASQGHPPCCEFGEILYIYDSCFFKICFSPGRGTNMKVELSAMWALFFLVSTLNLRKVQILGDSKVAIYTGKNQM